MPPTRPLRATLLERIEQIHNEVDALIQDRIAEEAAANPGVPAVSLRALFDSRYGICACRVAKRLNDEEKKAADPEAFEAAKEIERQEWLKNFIGA